MSQNNKLCFLKLLTFDSAMRCILSPLRVDQPYASLNEASAELSKDQLASKVSLVKAFGYAAEQVNRIIEKIRKTPDDVKNSVI